MSSMCSFLAALYSTQERHSKAVRHMNEVTVAGNVGRDAMLRTTSTGIKVCFFSVADDQFGANKPIWWRCSIIGDRAEKLAPHIKKGRGVSLVGMLREIEIVDKETGELKLIRELAVSQIMFHGSAGSKNNESEQPSENKPPSSRQPDGQPENTDTDIVEDDLNAPDPDDPDAEVPHYARNGWDDLGEL